MTKLISLIPALEAVGKGHDFNYNISVKNAAERNGWRYTAAIPISIKSDALPEEWAKVLPSHLLLHQKNLASRLKRMIGNILGIRKFIYGNLNNDHHIILLESFDPSFLFAFVISLLFLPQNAIEVWLLYRNENSCKGAKGLAHKNLTAAVHFILKSKNVKLLSDSRLLTEWFSMFFGRSVHLVPIPHTSHDAVISGFPQPKDKIICWVPGRQLEMEYNRKVVQHLSKLPFKGEPEIEIVISEKSQLHPREDSVTIKLVPDVLPPKDYEGWMQKSHIILLPYDPSRYTRCTSGIFVECICAGRIPIVTRGTWMASELAQFDLDDLAIDWQMPDIFDFINTVTASEQIRLKLQQMRQSYLAFHNETNFGISLNSIYSC